MTQTKMRTTKKLSFSQETNAQGAGTRKRKAKRETLDSAAAGPTNTNHTPKSNSEKKMKNLNNCNDNITYADV